MDVELTYYKLNGHHAGDHDYRSSYDRTVDVYSNIMDMMLAGTLPGIDEERQPCHVLVNLPELVTLRPRLFLHERVVENAKGSRHENP